MKINNKGFTLVELLAVMIILVSIALVAVGGITFSLEKREIKECREQQELAISAAKIYFSLNEATSVSIGVLNASSGGVDYFKNDNKIDRLSQNDEISFSNGKYVYVSSEGSCVVDDSIDDEENIPNEGDTITVTFDTKGGFIEGTEYLKEKLITTVGETQYIVPKTGEYKLEVWGAQGGYYTSYRSGYGGYSVGTVTLTEGTTLYANVGGAGSGGNEYEQKLYSGGYNGGGTGIGSGGGATHVATVSGKLKDLSSNRDSVLIVAGGGGGAYYGGDNVQCQGGDGGGIQGTTGIIYVFGSCAGSGGSQTSAGSASGCSGYGSGGFGVGGSSSDRWGSGGGGGWYGGGASPGLNDLDQGYSPGGGGSGYIGNSLLTNKYMYCYNCSTSNNVDTKTISTTNVSAEPIEKYAKEGNGAVKITMLTPTKKVVNGSPYGKLPTSSRESYIFVGWNTKADGTGEMITSDTIVNLNDDITLYAIWKSSTILLYNAGNTYDDITGGYSRYYLEWGGDGCTVSMNSNGIKFYSHNGALGFARTNNKIDLSNVSRLNVSISNMSSQYSFTIKVIVSDSALTSAAEPSALASNLYTGSAIPSGTSKTITVDVGNVSSGYVYVYLKARDNYTNVGFLVTKIMAE